MRFRISISLERINKLLGLVGLKVWVGFITLDEDGRQLHLYHDNYPDMSHDQWVDDGSRLVLMWRSKQS